MYVMEAPETKKTEKTEPNYLAVKTEIESQLSLPGEILRKIKISIQREEFQLEVKLPKLDDSSFMETMILAKRHWENWRIHTFERGFLSLQALNKNLFDMDGIMGNIKIRLNSLYGDSTLEISKKNTVTQSEVSFIVELLRHFLENRENGSPLERIAAAGCQVFEPQHESLSLNSLGGYITVKEQAIEAILVPFRNAKLIEEITQVTRMSNTSPAPAPKAVLFSGPPGVGKTTMARVIAKEANLPLVYVPVESIMSSYYGESSKKLALIFDTAFSMAKEGKNILIFLDEIDALAPSRHERIFEATRRILSVLLRKIDGMETQNNCLTIAATNRQDDLDQALISRFDTVISFPYPSAEDIVNILNINAKHLKQEEKTLLAQELNGKSPRFIQDICKKAERMHASYLIQSQISEVSPPSMEVYHKAILVSKN